jgi:hypothetical protein
LFVDSQHTHQEGYGSSTIDRRPVPGINPIAVHQLKKPFTWTDVCKIIGTPNKSRFNADLESGQVDKFRRWPSDLVKYFALKERILQSYPSVEKFVLTEKLHWPDPPIAHADFPYIDPRSLPALNVNT